MPADVSVIVPTILRPELRRALTSVRRQDFAGSIQVVVVADVDETTLSGHSIPLEAGEELVVTGGGKRGGGARQHGVRHAHGEWIAFLDDDDEWTPEHLSSLMSRVHSAGWDGTVHNVVLASRARQGRHGEMPSGRHIVPARPIAPGEAVEDYLFRKRQLSLSRASLFTSTLLVSRHIAEMVPWDETLSRHQDWDWLLRAQRAGAVVEHVSEASCIVHVGTADSISASTNWEASLAWVQEAGRDWSRPTFVDFVVGQPLRYALTARSATGVRRCLALVARNRHLPSCGPLLLGLAGIVGRRRLEGAMLRGARARKAIGPRA